MKFIKLSNGVEMPMQGIGTFLLTPDEAEASATYALKNGCQLIDTANAYCNEKAVGRAMKNAGIDRKNIFLETKLWPSFYEQDDAVDKTLDRLQTDYIDLLLIHQPAGNYIAGYGKYKKSSRNRYVYIVIETTTVIFTFCINMLNHSILNLVVWGVLTGIIVYVLYYEDIDKPLRRIIECEALVFCMSVCESLGVILLQCILQAADIKNVNETMLYCLEVTFSKVILIFLYYTFINRFVKKSDVPYSNTRYIMYGIILLYSLINMSVIVENFKNGEENYLCEVNMGCIVLADLYLLYFVKMADEKNYYEKQLIALEQQAKVQYEYYLTQAKKYDQTIQILHDVNKHIKAIEGLYGAEQEKTAGEYATKIRELLKPLIPVQYTENPILNILLTDKESVMREKGISVTIKIDNVNLNFIEPIDITTIFGNLLDNAIEATEKLKGEKYICIKIGSYHKMIVVSIENNCNEVKWKNGFPVSNKGKNGGIGLLNVQSSIKKYDGDLTLKNDGNKFAAELFLNS